MRRAYGIFAGSGQTEAHDMNSMIYKKKAPLLFFLLPAFAFLVVYLYYPFVQNIINSFLAISGLGTKASGVNTPWFANYVELWNDPNMRTAVKNTLLLVVCTLVFQVGTALVLALIIDRIKVGAKFFRTLYFFPIVISATALGLPPRCQAVAAAIAKERHRMGSAATGMVLTLLILTDEEYQDYRKAGGDADGLGLF